MDANLESMLVQRGFARKPLADRDLATGAQIQLSKLKDFKHGTGTVTFTASATSATVNITHNLSTTPTAILLTPDSGIAFCLLEVTAKSTTTFTVQGRDTDGTSRTGTNTFYWLAIV